MPGHPIEEENPDLGCCYNTDTVFQLLTFTNSFNITGKEGTLQAEEATSEKK